MAQPPIRFLTLILTAAFLLAGCISTDAPSDDSTLDDTGAEVDLSSEVAALHEMVEAAIADGAPVTLTAKAASQPYVDVPIQSPEQDFEVLLQPSHVLPDDVWVQVDDNETEMPFVAAYEGHVVGAEDQLVRLTLAEDWARGSVRVDDHNHLIRLGLDGNLPALNGTTGTQDTEARAAGKALPATFDRDGQEPHDCLSLAPTDLQPAVDVGQSGFDELTARIILDGDTGFFEQLGDHAYPMMVAMLQETDAIYQYETGVRLQVAGLHQHSNFSFDVDAGDPFAPVRDHWNARDHLERDVVHIFTGTESSYAMANCIGGAGMPELAYTFTPLNWAADYEVFHITALAHELGHIFNAHHHYGNHVEAGGELATLMIQGYTPGVNPAFSTVSKTTIRGWAEAHVGS